MLCEKHGPRASVTTKTEAEGLCLSHGMGDHDQILQYAPADPIYASSLQNCIHKPSVKHLNASSRTGTWE